MSPFQLLQVAQDADEREIKLAYARLLKKNRPDDDAAAFQRLQEAYESCLAMARGREKRVGSRPAPAVDRAKSADTWPVEEPSTVDGVQVRTPLPPPPGQREHRQPTPPPRAFDANAFVERLHTLLADPDARKMRAWLNGHESLYSVDLKHALRPVVVRALHDAPGIANPNVATVLLEFFGLDSVDRDGMAARAQAVLEGKRREELLDRAVRRLHNPGSDFVQRRIGRELKGDAHWLRRWFLLLTPTLPTRIGSTLFQLRRIHPHLPHPALHLPTIAFWDQVLDKHALHRTRIWSMMTRIVLANMAFFGLVMLLAMPTHRLRVLGTALLCTVGLAATWFTYAWLRVSWRRMSPWLQRRLNLPDVSVHVLLWLAGGLAFTWMLGLGPIPLGFVLLLSCLRLSRGQPNWVAPTSLGALIAIAVAFWIIGGATPLAASAELRVSFALSATALPLILQVVALRHDRSPRLSRWIAPGFALLAIIASFVVSASGAG